MLRFYLTGQRSFGNRGCEAIVRSTVGLLNQTFDQVEILVPSDDIPRDSGQWPDAHQQGVRFVDAYFPFFARYWVNLQRFPLKVLKQAVWPFPMPRKLRDMFSGVDAVLSVGGDNYSLDYRLPSPLMGIDRLAMDMGKPVVLWGASVGPFDAEPHFMPVIKKHLARMRLIAVRESASEAYLRESLGLSNIVQVADPAFTLDPEGLDLQSFWPQQGKAGVLGLNLSPLIARYRNEPDSLLQEVAPFIRHVVKDLDLSILLVPHVVPLDGDKNNNDAVYMQKIVDRAGTFDQRVRVMDSHLNAAQIKYVASRCRFFIGARTHSTIAALSSGTPTVSLAYSVKAKGINKDIFDHLDYVLDTPEISASSLTHMLDRLISDEKSIKLKLEERMGQIRDNARLAATRLKSILTGSRGAQKQNR